MSLVKFFIRRCLKEISSSAIVKVCLLSF